MKFLNFRLWLTENDTRTGARLGLYTDIGDTLGNYPPLAVTPTAADFVTYYDIEYSQKPLKMVRPGIADPKDLARLKNPFKWTSFDLTKI